MKTELFGLNIDNYTFEDALYKATGLMHTDKVSQVVTINPEMIMAASSETNEDGNLKRIINEAEMVIPDGIGVSIALKINGCNANRIPGIDFARKLLELCAKSGTPIALIGAKNDVIKAAVERLYKEILNINIVYYHDGYFNNDYEIYENLRNTKPSLILVAMGSPRQEEFIYNAKKVLDKGLMVGIGGSLDVWSGKIKRAPAIFRKTGTEWLYRTVTQPERFKRIFPTLPLFILEAFKYKYKN